jgi:hypothetical protein
MLATALALPRAMPVEPVMVDLACACCSLLLQYLVQAASSSRPGNGLTFQVWFRKLWKKRVITICARRPRDGGTGSWNPVHKKEEEE